MTVGSRVVMMFLLSAVAVWTKREGLVFAVYVFVAVVFARALQARKEGRSLFEDGRVPQRLPSATINGLAAIVYREINAGRTEDLPDLLPDAFPEIPGSVSRVQDTEFKGVHTSQVRPQRSAQKTECVLRH